MTNSDPIKVFINGVESSELSDILSRLFKMTETLSEIVTTLDHRISDLEKQTY